MRHGRRLVAALTLIVSARHALAQQLRGTITDSANRTPIAGAVVLLLDSAGATLGRNITDDRGQYRMAMPPAVQRLRVVRIGFRPSVVAVPTSIASMTQVDVTMVAIPTLLDPVQVRSGAHCSRRPDRAAAFARLEQARAGLLATVVARETKPAQMVRLRFTRRMRESSDQIQSQDVRIDSSNQITASFHAARTTADFIRLGFARDSAGTREFFGPDAEVLLDESLADGYCIEGALWIDTVARELRHIEFQYLGLERAFDAFRPGGRIAFRGMDNGVVLIDRWFLRLVGATADTIVGRDARTIRRHLFATESGGEVASALWPDGFAWHGSFGALAGRTIDRSGDPSSGTIVGLAGTDYRAIADSKGEFEISNLLPGPYSVTVVDSTLAALGVALKTSLSFTAERDSVIQATFRVPTASEFVVAACLTDMPSGDKLVGMQSAKLIGRVVSSRGQPVAGAKIRLSVDDIKHDWSVVALNGKTGADGLFHWCNDLPMRHRIEIMVERDGQPPYVTRADMAREVTVIKIVLPPN